MKKLLVTISVAAVALLLAFTCADQATAASTVKIKLLNPPHKNKPFELAVGESYTFDILLTSDEPFTVAMAMPDAYYPGRGVFWHGRDGENQNTSALLHLTMTGRNSTADLPAVCDWPEPGDCWPEGVAPVAIAVGARFAGGQVYGEQFPFAVVVP
jgi:hypothetical protein